MNPFALIVLLGVLPIVAFAVGVLLARAGQQKGLTSAEKRELNSYRNLVGDLTSLAGEHSALGDNFAVIALQKINNQRRELNK